MIRKKVEVKTKKITSDHMLLLWSCKRMSRKAATEAFEEVGMAALIPKVDHHAALLRAAKDVCSPAGIRCKLKFFSLPGGSDTVGCEVREFQPGATRNELPFLFSLGAVCQSDNSYKVEVLESAYNSVPSVAHMRFADWQKLATLANDIWQDACREIETNDLTQAITGLVKLCHGFLAKDEGHLWAMPLANSDKYLSVAKALRRFGTCMHTIVFDPVLNAGFMQEMCEQLDKRSMDVLSGLSIQADAMSASGAVSRANGRQTRLDAWALTVATLEANKQLLGKSFARLAKAAREAKIKLGEAGIAIFGQ